MNCAALSRTEQPEASQPNGYGFNLRKIIITGMMLICVMSVSACGKKPAHVDPPDDETGIYPRIYPDPATVK
jgi:hypothetical protein